MNILNHLTNAQARHPGRAAVIRDCHSMSYDELLLRSERIGRGLSALGDEARMVAILTPTGELPPLYYGSFLAGKVAVPLNYSFRAGEIARVFDNCKPDVLIVHTSFLGEMAKVGEASRRSIRHKYVIGNWRGSAAVDYKPFSSVLSGPRGAIGVREGGIIFHTSGTTGVPKGAFHTLHSASHFARGYFHLFKGEDWPTTIIARNCYHSGGFYNLTGALSCGTTCIITDIGGSFDAESYLCDVKKYRATQLFLNVSMLNGILQARNVSPECFRHASFISAGADEVKPFHHERLARYTDLPLSVRYSSTEGTSVSINDSEDAETLLYTIGRPFEYIEYRIAQDSELLLRGPNLFREYYNNPEETRRAFTPDGWYRTGDLVHGNPDGNLVFLGRSRDIIKVGGKIVYPEEIECVAIRYPSIEEAVAVAVDDEIDVHAPFLFVRMKSGRCLDRADFRSYLGERIASYKVPVQVVVLKSFPITSCGKLDRKTLAAEALRMRRASAEHDLSA